VYDVWNRASSWTGQLAEQCSLAVPATFTGLSMARKRAGVNTRENGSARLLLFL
jgi:hypothetical protein